MNEGSAKVQTWKLDQLFKSLLFHQKLHEWGLLEIAEEIEKIRGERLDWNKEQLHIAEDAWNKTIHRGIKPVRVFAHPKVLVRNPKRVSYYRMLSMVSQKSMQNIGLTVKNHEEGRAKLEEPIALTIAQRLNELISSIIEMDQVLNERELDLWRAMAAGTQAQGTAQNIKGSKAEGSVKKLVREHIISHGLGTFKKNSALLKDGRKVIFGSDPDIRIYRDEKIESSTEIKGGIDAAGIHERRGAALKSFQNAKDQNESSINILVLPTIALTSQAKSAIEKSDIIDCHFDIEELLKDPNVQEKFFQLLGL